MSKEINYDDMSYDEVEAILQQIDSGTFEQEDSTATTADDETETNDLGSDEDNNAEDTDDSDDLQEGTDTEDQDDDSDTATGSEGVCRIFIVTFRARVCIRIVILIFCVCFFL